MTWRSWLAKKSSFGLFSKPRRSSGPPAATPRSQSSNTAAPADAAQADMAGRKNAGAPRRELLYATMRQALASANMPPAQYKAKAVSLDGSGQQFLLLVDLSAQPGIDTKRLNQLEVLIVQAARVQADIAVAGVYWRIDAHAVVAPSAPWSRRSAPAQKEVLALASPAAPLSNRASANADAAAPAAAPAVAKQPLGARLREIFAPIEEDDVAAFQRTKAKAAGALADQAPADDSRH